MLLSLLVTYWFQTKVKRLSYTCTLHHRQVHVRTWCCHGCGPGTELFSPGVGPENNICWCGNTLDLSQSRGRTLYQYGYYYRFTDGKFPKVFSHHLTKQYRSGDILKRVHVIIGPGSIGIIIKAKQRDAVYIIESIIFLRVSPLYYLIIYRTMELV